MLKPYKQIIFQLDKLYSIQVQELPSKNYLCIHSVCIKAVFKFEYFSAFFGIKKVNKLQKFMAGSIESILKLRYSNLLSGWNIYCSKSIAIQGVTALLILDARPPICILQKSAN